MDLLQVQKEKEKFFVGCSPSNVQEIDQKVSRMCRVDVILSKAIALLFSVLPLPSCHLKLPNDYDREVASLSQFAESPQ